MQSSLPRLIAGCLLLVMLVGCELGREEGSLRTVESRGGALAAEGHPAPSELGRQAAAAGWTIDPLAPALNGSGQPLRSASVADATGGEQLASAGGELGWVIYYASGVTGDPLPDQLSLEFQNRSGDIWLGLPDMARSRWEWQVLPAGDSVAVYLDSVRFLNDEQTIFFTLAVHDGAAALFTGGSVSVSGQVEPEPGPGPEPEPEPEPGPGPVVETPDPIGAYLSLGYWDTTKFEDIMTDLEAAGVNFVIDYALIPPEDEYWESAFQQYLDSAEAHGIGVAFSLKELLSGATPVTATAQFSDVVAQVNALKNQTAITAWYVHDEVLPSISGTGGTMNYCLSLEQMQQLYTMIHNADPSRPQIAVWCYLPGYEEFNLVYSDAYTPYGRPDWMGDEALYEQALADMIQGSCDWVVADSYPVGAPWREASAGPPENDIAALTSRAAALKRADQPLTFVFQAFSWAMYDPTGAADAPFPTLDEMNTMLGVAHLCGATGAIAYSWFDLTEDLENRNIAGRDQALADLITVLTTLSTTGWPEAEMPVGAGSQQHPQVVVPPVVEAP